NRSRLDQQPRHNRVRNGDPVNLAPFQLGKKCSRIHDNGGKVKATRFLCTNRNTHRDGVHTVQLVTECPMVMVSPVADGNSSLATSVCKSLDYCLRSV